LYSSYGAQQSGAVDNEVNMPILTYIINNFKVGDTVAQCGGEVIEFADIQVAIWMFIDDVALGTVAPVIQNDITGVQYPHDQCIVDYIVDESTPHSNYEPDCNDSGELIAVVMVANGYPDGTTVAIQNQVIIAEVPVAGTAFCDCPNAAPTPTGSVIGDPHLKTWTGDHYDFHGICDLVLLQNPDFFSGKGMDIHIRTSKIKQWSYISAAVLRIGDETLEVTTENNQFQYYLNKVEGAGLRAGISGFEVSLNKVNTVQSDIVVDMGEAGSIKFTTFKEMIRVDVKSGVKNVFGSSLGLMGQYGSGKWLARDSATVMEDATEFGMEWQVRPEEPMLFHKVAGPQAPQKCELPSATSVRRRLLANTVTLEEAQVACGRVNEDDRDMCIFDVLAMDDKDVAGVY